MLLGPLRHQPGLLLHCRRNQIREGLIICSGFQNASFSLASLSARSMSWFWMPWGMPTHNRVPVRKYEYGIKTCILVIVFGKHAYSHAHRVMLAAHLRLRFVQTQQPEGTHATRSEAIHVSNLPTGILCVP